MEQDSLRPTRKITELFDRCFPQDKWEKEKTAHPLMSTVYPFDIQVICFYKSSLRTKYWQDVLDLSREVVELIVSRKSIPGHLDELHLIFPERWLSPGELQSFISDLLANPAAKGFKKVRILTNSTVLLTNFFGEQVKVLPDPTGEPRSVKGGLFGTDPGEVAMNLFMTETSMGSQASNYLDRLLKEDWKGREVELATILNELGSSFHRAELRAILKKANV